MMMIASKKLALSTEKRPSKQKYAKKKKALNKSI